MRTIAHLSDLHFGRHDEAVVAGLLRLMHEIAPDLVVISGDLTQRARTEEFRLAQAFLRELPSRVLAVPGNHDVPLYDVASRWLRPLDKFRHFISDEPEPAFVDDEIAVVGINTARSLTWKNGRINERQIEHIRERLARSPPTALRVLVTHHPFDLPPAASGEAVVGRAAMAMAELIRCRVDVILSGHLHIRHTGSSAHRYKVSGRPILLVQAGTATSTRQRGEVNSCDLLHVGADDLAIEWLAWNAARRSFEQVGVEQHRRGPRE